MASPSAPSTPFPSSGRSSRFTRSAGGPAGAAPSGISPTRLSRVQEKEELQHLNDRLANYIQRTIELESQRSAMHLLLEEKEESKTREMSSVRRLYETELADTRSSLDEMANDRARLELEYGNLSEEHTKLRARNQKKEGDLAHALTQWRNLEEALNSKEADYSNQLAKTKMLTNDVAELQAQQKHLEAVLADTKTQMNSEMLKRVDMENQMQTLKEQLDFERNLKEQEVHEIRRKHESRLVEVDSGRRSEFDTKLAEALQQLRQEHDVHIQQYKDELERNFNAKLENAQQTALRKSDADSTTKDELSTTKVRVENLSSQLQLYQKEKAVLESRAQELERTLDRERELWSRRLGQKEQEMQIMQSKLLSQLDDYENLLDVKLALDMEINAYRKMLEGEEQRLHLSPSPSQHTAVPRTHAQGARRGTKRKLEASSGSTPAYKMSMNSKAHGPISIAEVDLEGNYVTLKNNSDTEQPLEGWVVRRTHPNITDVSFHIPPSCVLHGGQTLTIWGADTEVKTDPGNIVMQGHKSWGPVKDVRVVLLSPEQEETAERHVVWVQATGEDESEMMIHEEYIVGRDIQHLRRLPKKRKSICDLCSVS